MATKHPVSKPSKAAKTEVSPLKNNSKSAQKTASKRIAVRSSGVHGKGVFAEMDIAEGETLIEYKGEVIKWKEALRRHPHNPKEPNHTFFFSIDDKHVIDGNVNGNSARWINHSCKPNCEADEKKAGYLSKPCAIYKRAKS